MLSVDPTVKGALDPGLQVGHGAVVVPEDVVLLHTACRGLDPVRVPKLREDVIRLEAVRDDLTPALDGIQRKVHEDRLDRVVDVRVKKVITNMGILEPDDTGELTLTALYPGVTFETVQENIGWALKKAPRLAEVSLPTGKEIELLRTKLDPKRLHIK